MGKLVDSSVDVYIDRPLLVHLTRDPVIQAIGLAQFQLLITELTYCGKAPERLQEKEEALTWMLSDDVELPCSFINLCDQFGINHRAAREAFLSMATPEKTSKKTRPSRNFKKRTRVRMISITPKFLGRSSRTKSS